MWIALAALALLAVAVAIVVLLRRPSGDDLDSVRSYHSTLGTLEHLTDRSSQPAVTVTARGEGGGPGSGRQDLRSYDRGRSVSVGGVDPGRSVPPVPVRGSDDFPDPGVPLVFDDARPQDRYRRGHSDEGPLPPRTVRARRQALDSMNHRPRRMTAVAVVVAAVVVFGVLAYVGSKRTSSHNPRSAGTPHTTTSSSARSATGRGTTSSTVSKPTPTTQPSQLVAVTSTPTSATYPVVHANYKLTVTGTGTCWVAVTAASGSTLWAGEVQAGSVQVVPVGGTVTVQLGTPSVTLAVDKVPVVLPTPTRAPFVATFQPTAAALAASTPTTVPTTSSGGVASSGSTVTGSTPAP